MSELDRRLLLAGAGLAGVAALGRLAKAGPLDPPPGPVAPTGKTLAEVYDKIARSDAGLAEPRIPVESLPMDENGTRTITQSGSYYLLGDLTNLVIAASYVQLDLQGFRMPSPAFACISVSGNYVKIHNGTIENGSPIGVGIFANGTVIGLCLEDLIIQCRGTSLGKYGPSRSLSRCLIQRCVFIGGGSDAVKIIADDFVSVFDCFVETGVYAISAGQNAHIARCSVNCNGLGSPGGECIQVGDYSLIENCRTTSLGNATGCIISGSQCQIVDCTATQLSTVGGSEALRVGEGSSISRCLVQSGRTGVVLGNGSSCQGTTIKGGRLGALLAGDRCVIEDCNVHSIPLLSTPAIAMTLGNRCVVRRNVLSDVEAGVAIRASGSHNRIEENTVSSCGTGIETIGTGNLVARNHCTLNTTDYSLAPGTKAGPIVSSPADPNGSHPWANFAT